jgi:hypothetical protein
MKLSLFELHIDYLEIYVANQYIDETGNEK